MDKSKVAVVIPFYKQILTPYEELALQQCCSILALHPLIACKPKSLQLPVKASLDIFNSLVNFDDAYFTGIAGYNQLMLSADFYDSFSDFEYILIYQLDAFVFRDDLSYWCDQDYDYIGAPWIRKKHDDSLVKKAVLSVQQKMSTSFNLKKHGVPNKYQFEGKVGNGGFSLRRVDTFKHLSHQLQPKIAEYLKQNAHQYNEDAFWSIEVNRKNELMNIPDWKTGLNFAFENQPENCLGYTNGKLPFGCHAWDKHVDFWRPIFNDIGIPV